MKDKDDIAKKRIFNLRKDKAYKGKIIIYMMHRES